MVIATTASAREVARTLGKSTEQLYEDLSFTQHQEYTENEKKFYVFAFLPIIDGNKEVVEPLQQAGFEVIIR